MAARPGRSDGGHEMTENRHASALAWWLTRVAFISLLILIYLANRAWRREMD
jgi:hypothetical protein